MKKTILGLLLLLTLGWQGASATVDAHSWIEREEYTAVGDTVELSVKILYDGNTEVLNLGIVLMDFVWDVDALDFVGFDKFLGGSYSYHPTVPGTCGDRNALTYISESFSCLAGPKGGDWVDVGTIKLQVLTSGSHTVRINCHNNSDNWVLDIEEIAPPKCLLAGEELFYDDIQHQSGGVVPASGGGGCHPPCEFEKAKPGFPTTWSKVKGLYKEDD